MSRSKPQRIVVLGAGPVGSLLSVFLGHRGHIVDVYERRPDMRTTAIPAGRSINLACSDRGWKALEMVGVADRVRETAIPMRGRMLHEGKKTLTFLPYGREDQAIYALSRGLLNKTLMSFAEEQPRTTIHFRHRCTNVDLSNSHVEILDEEHNKELQIEADLVFGADGASSALRRSMLGADRFDYAQRSIEHGYKELTIPSTQAGDFAMESNALHIWPRGKCMLIALPNADRTFTCTLFLPFRGANSFASLRDPQRVSTFFEETFPDAVALMPALEQHFSTNPTSSLMTLRCYPWVHGGRFALIGDAAHAVVPFYGQGMVAGFEDCSVLDACIDAGGQNWPAILENYQLRRKANTDAIADLALSNFVEMRDLVREPTFKLKKRIERRLHELFPQLFVPTYSMVTFSQMPYAEAMARGERQQSLLAEIARIEGIEEELSNEHFVPQLKAALTRWQHEQQQ